MARTKKQTAKQAETTDEKVARTLYVCNHEGCVFSTRENTDKPYDVVSVPEGQTGKCPLCGNPVTEVEDGNHAFKRLESMRVGRYREIARLIIGTINGNQYDPTADDLQAVHAHVTAGYDMIRAALDRRMEKIMNPGTVGRKRGTPASKKPKFAL